MRVLISGSTGLIGAELILALKDRGHQVVRLVRHEFQRGENKILWDPEHYEIDVNDFEGFDVVINLAGENISSGRWTHEKKKKILNSRVIGTHMLSELLKILSRPPRVFISASAVGIYGSCGDQILDESLPPGDGFLAEVCTKWEQAAKPAADKGVRVLLMRMGAVLSEKGGVLGKMLLPFKLCLGGVIGSGEQYMSWISIDDLIGAFLHVISNESISGPVNVVAPAPVTNREFTKTLGKILSRPTILPLPAFAAKLLFGEMARELLLSSARVAPKKLEESGYSFLYPDLASALRHLLES